MKKQTLTEEAIEQYVPPPTKAEIKKYKHNVNKFFSGKRYIYERKGRSR